MPNQLIRKFHGEKAERYQGLLADADVVLSSTLYQAECVNVLWKYVRTGIVREEDAVLSIDRLFGPVDLLVDPEENDL